MKYLLRILTFTFSSLFLLNSNAQTYVPGGTLASANWTSDASPYIIQGDIEITGKLKVGPGVDVQIDGYYQIVVLGHLQVDGTELMPVSFSAVDTTGWHLDISTSGGWRGIYAKVNYTRDSSYLKHCLIKDTKSNNNELANGEAALRAEREIFLDHCEFTHHKHYNLTYGNQGVILWMSSVIEDQNTVVQNCKFHNNKAFHSVILYNGIIGGTFELKNSHIHHNSEGLGINLLNTHALIENNEFDHNVVTHPFSAVILAGPGEHIIRGNKIHHNKTYKTAALTCLDTKAIIEKNLICNNEMTYGNCGLTDGGGGIHIAGLNGWRYETHYTVRDNIIANNKTAHYAGGIYIHTCNADIYNNTIVNNFAETGYSAGINVYGFGVLNLHNNIITGNENAAGSSRQLSILAPSELHFNHNYLGTSVYESLAYNEDFDCDTLNCVTDTEVNFVNPTLTSDFTEDATTKNFALLPSSSCIDAGSMEYTFAGHTDFSSSPRVQGESIDIGAIEYFKTVNTGLTDLNQPSLHIYPNPNNGQFTLTGLSDDVIVTMFSLTGKKIGSFYGPQSPDYSHVEPGVYVLQIEADGNINSLKVIKK